MTTQTNAAAVAMQETLLPGAHLMQLSVGCFISQAVYVAARLGLADLIGDEPCTVKDLAEKTATHERSLYRILRTLASAGVFRETQEKVFANTLASAAMRSDAAGSLRDIVIWMGEPEHWRVYGEMLASVKTGEPVWAKVHGMEGFPYLFEENRALGEIFDSAMTSFSSQTIPAILEAYDFSDAKTVADIAGGRGHLLAAILNQNPNIERGILFDAPVVLTDAPALLERENVADKTELVAGDFFAEVPVAADVYLLKHIIHDWSDELAISILKNIAKSMKDDAKILILDAVIADGNEPHFAKVLDMEMMVSVGGVERTEAEHREILAASGLKLARVIPTKSPVSILEAVKK